MNSEGIHGIFDRMNQDKKIDYINNKVCITDTEEDARKMAEI